MRVIRLFAFALTLVATFNAQSVDSHHVLTEWYSDSTYNDVVGSHEKDCDGYITTWGTTSNWRSTIFTSCTTGSQTVSCSHWNGSSWTAVRCYLGSDARVHIPVG
jgi:hypothetical protein